MNEWIEQMNATVSPETLGKGWKNIKSRINHFIGVNGVHIEQPNMWKPFLDNLFYCRYSGPQKGMIIFLQRFYKPLKEFLHTLYIDSREVCLVNKIHPGFNLIYPRAQK